MIAHPYPGLRPFNRDEDEIFFGREAQVNQLLDKLADTHFLAVLGTSGSGKSSLVRAGLLPSLDAGFMAGGGARWAVAELRPRDRPFQRLAASLVRDTEWGKVVAASAQTDRSGPPVRDQSPGRIADSTASIDTDEAIAALEQNLRRGSLALNWRLGVQPLTEGTRLLILVDQFEELFRYHRTAGEDAIAFVALLLAAATHPDVYVVITLRSEFLGDCARYPELPEAINAGLFLTPRLTSEQMADAIQLPARLFGGEMEPELANRLLKEARGEMDQLPLLQHALMRLWGMDVGDRRLTLKELEKLGGLRKILDDHAEKAFGELDTEQQRIAEVLFRSLTERGPAERDTRRPVRLGEVADLAEVQTQAVAEVVEVFHQPGRSFLMPTAETELKTDTILDITHEALIRQWQRLQQWTENEAKQAELYVRLESAAGRHKDGKGARWIDPDLEFALQWREERKPARAWAARYGGDYDLAMQFLEASRKARDEQREAEERRRRNEIKRERLIAETERRHAEQAEAEKQQRARQLFDASLTHAALLTRLEDYAEAREVLSQTVELDPDIPETRRHVRNLRAGHVAILVGSADKVYEGAGAALSGGVTVSPDDRRLAAAGERGTLVLFDAESGELVKRLKGHDPNVPGTNGSVNSVVFDPEGRWLYSGAEDRRIIRWSVPDGEKLDEWKAPAQVWALAISPDGKLLASGGTDDAVTLWSTDTGEQLRTLEGHTASIAGPNGLDFSPDGKRLASASSDKTARIWDVETGKSLHTLKSHNEELQAVAFSPDGGLIATASVDKRIVLWEADTGRSLRLFTGHDNIVFGVAFDAAGRRLMSASRDKTLRLWDVATGVTLRVYQGHTAGLWSVARHGDTLYTAANDQTVRRWSLATPGQWVWKLPEKPDAVALSPDASLIAVGFANGALRVYDRVTGDEKALVEDAHGDIFSRLAFNADGTLLASASHDDTAKLWQIDRPVTGLILTPLHTLEGHTDAVHAVAFSPDGRTLATAGYDGRVGLFDVESGEGELFEAHEGWIADVEFDAGGKRLLSVGIHDFKLRLWDLTKQPPEPREVAKAKDKLLWTTLRPDGRQAAAVGREAVVTLHDLGPEPAESRLLVGHEETVMRAIYSPDGRQLATIGDMTVRLWDLETHKELFALRLPARSQQTDPYWDFDFRCTDQGECWIAVPLTMGRLALYRLPYDHPPKSLTHP